MATYLRRGPPAAHLGVLRLRRLAKRRGPWVPARRLPLTCVKRAPRNAGAESEALIRSRTRELPVAGVGRPDRREDEP